MESLKPQDVVVVLKLCAGSARKESASPSMAALGVELGMSASEIHAAIGRARLCGLLALPVPVLPRTTGRAPERRGGTRHRPNTSAITEFIVHGLKYVFPVQRGELTRGIPTSYGAPPLSRRIAKGGDPIPVWPTPDGKQRGVAIEPLYPTVPLAAMRDRELYELLVLADALREGRARERRLAQSLLVERLAKVHAD